MARNDVTFFQDPFDSPLVSPTPLTGNVLLNDIPSSTLAEHILNDPEAWEVPGDANTHRLDDHLSLDELELEEEMTWLDNEVMLSMPFTPSILGVAGSPLSDEDDTILPSLVPSPDIDVYPPLQGLKGPKRLQHAQTIAAPKPCPLGIYPAHIHNPLSGFDIPRQELMKGLAGLEGDETIHLLNLNPGSPHSFGADLHARLVRVLSETNDATRHIIDRIPGSPVDISPPSEYSSSSSSGSSCGFRSFSSSNSSQTSPIPPPAAIKLGASDDAVKREHQPNTVLLSGREGSDKLPEGINGDDREIQSLLVRYDISSKFSFPEKGKRCGIICRSPPRRGLKSPLLLPRDSPKPAPIIPLPDLPVEALPAVPPKDSPHSPPKTDVNSTKANIRRLPRVPTKRMAPECEPNNNTSSCPPCPPRHLRTHVPHHSISSIFSLATAPMTPPRTGPRSINTTSPSSVNPCSGANSSRSPPPCPAGPRQRTCLNTNYIPIKPVWYTKTEINHSTSVMSTVTSDKSLVPTVVRRSISEPRSLPRHVYSKSG